MEETSHINKTQQFSMLSLMLYTVCIYYSIVLITSYKRCTPTLNVVSQHFNVGPERFNATVIAINFTNQPANSSCNKCRLIEWWCWWVVFTHGCGRHIYVGTTPKYSLTWLTSCKYATVFCIHYYIIRPYSVLIPMSYACVVGTNLIISVVVR